MRTQTQTGIPAQLTLDNCIEREASQVVKKREAGCFLVLLTVRTSCFGTEVCFTRF